MIINVRGCSNKPGIIISYLVENEEKTGYDSFNAKKIIVKNKIDMLAAIKKTLISSRKLPEINASDFISTINKVGRKNVFDTSLKTIVKSVNDENMQSTMSTLSHVYFNNKPLPQVKAINIINGNMYFMVKVGPSYNLELIKSERIKCVIVISSLVNLYRRIKQGGASPKGGFKKHYISRPGPRSGASENVRNVYRAYREENSDEDSPAEPILEESVNSSTIVIEEIVPPANNTNWYGPTLYTYSGGVSTETTRRQAEDLANMNRPTTERQRAEQRMESLYTGLTETNEAEERPADAENAVTEGPDIDEERPTGRHVVVNGDRVTITELPQPETTEEEEEEEEEERPIRIDLAAAEERYAGLQTPEANLTNTDREETEAERTEREAEITISAAETFEDEEDILLLAEREAEEERREEAERERRDNLRISIPEASAEIAAREAEVAVSIAEAMAVNEERQRATMSVESPRRREEMNTNGRRSFVEYLRENQTGAFDNLRENNNTDTSY